MLRVRVFYRLAILLFPGTDANPQTLRLHRQGFFDFQPVSVMVDQFESMQHHSEHQRRLMQGELASDTRALAVAKRLVCAGGPRTLGVGSEIIWIKDFRI